MGDIALLGRQDSDPCLFALRTRSSIRSPNAAGATHALFIAQPSRITTLSRIPESPKRSAIAAWNLRRLGQGGFGETSWLKLRACTRLAVRRGWRSILISDCMADAPGSFSFRGPGGNWLLLFNCRCGVFLDPGMANMWRRGGNIRYDSSDGRSLAVIVPCAGRGVRGRVLSLVSVYGPVSGAGFDADRQVMFDELSLLMSKLPVRSVWVVGGDFNAEVGSRGDGEEEVLGRFSHGRRTLKRPPTDGMGQW